MDLCLQLETDDYTCGQRFWISADTKRKVRRSNIVVTGGSAIRDLRIDGEYARTLVEIILRAEVDHARLETIGVTCHTSGERAGALFGFNIRGRQLNVAELLGTDKRVGVVFVVLEPAARRLTGLLILYLRIVDTDFSTGRQRILHAQAVSRIFRMRPGRRSSTGDILKRRR